MSFEKYLDVYYSLSAYEFKFYLDYFEQKAIEQEYIVFLSK